MHNSIKEPLPMKWIERIFLQLHGRLGNPFFDNYRIGELDENGKDIGIENAKHTWSQKLGGISAERIKNALDAEYKKPPSYDDFIKNCISKPVINDFKALPAPKDYEASKAQAHKLNEIAKEIIKPKTDHKIWVKKILQREKNGDKSLSDLALKLAKEVAKDNEIAA